MTPEWFVILVLSAPLIAALCVALLRLAAWRPFVTRDANLPLICSFCGKPQEETAKMIAGPTVFICDECVTLSAAVIRESPKRIPSKLPPPADIEAAIAAAADMAPLDRRRLALAAYHHARRAECGGFSPVPGPAILLVGPKGSGKARLAESIARVMGVAFKSGDLSHPAKGFHVLSDSPPFARGAVIYVAGVEDIAHLSEQNELVQLIDGRRWYQKASEFLFIFGSARPELGLPDEECSDAKAWVTLLAHGLDIDLVRRFSPVVRVGKD